MTILARARTACAIALIASAAILATAASYGQDSHCLPVALRGEPGHKAQ